MAADDQPVDRSSPVPLYHQLVARLRAEIDDGAYAAGDALPSESELCDTYGVSRSVVRQTLTNLAHDGLIRTERGRGSFVAERKLQERFVQRTTGLYDDLRRMGHRVRTHVVRQEATTLPLQVQQFFGTERGIQVDRVRSVDDRKLAYIRTYLSAARCPAIETADLEDRSLYGLLQDRYGLKPATGRRTVEAVSVEDPVAQHLDVPISSPILLLRSRSWDEDGLPLEWFDAWHRADRTIFEIEIVPDIADHPVNSVVVDPALANGGERACQFSMVRSPTPEENAGSRTEQSYTAEFVAELRRQRALVTLRGDGTSKLPDVIALLIDYGFPVISVAASMPADALASIADISERAWIGWEVVPEERDEPDRVGFVVVPVGTEANQPLHPRAILMSAFTPAEVRQAWRTTHAPVVVTPAGPGGVSYFQSLVESAPNIPLIAGEITEEEQLAAFLDVGALAVDVGRLIAPRKTIEGGNLEAIAASAGRVRRLIDTVSSDG